MGGQVQGRDCIPLETVRGIGSAMVSMLREIGIEDRATLAELGAVEAYLRLRFAVPHVTFNALWALAAGPEGRDWRSLVAQEKAALKAQLPPPARLNTSST